MKKSVFNFSFAMFGVLCILLIVFLPLTNRAFSVDNQNQRQNVIANMTEKEITKMKSLNDFSDGKYSVYETSDLGYFIFSDATNELMEWSLKSRSPYYGYETNLYYGGLQGYYLKIDTLYNNLLTGEYLNSDQFDEMEQTSDRIQECSKKSVNAIQTRATPAGYTYVKNYNIIQNMDFQCGYVTEGEYGLCGYVALAIMIAYYSGSDTSAWITNGDYVDDASGFPVAKIQLTQELRRIGIECGYSDTGTTSVSANKIASKYASNVGISIKKTDLTLFIFYSTIKSHIENSRPVILFGNIKDPQTQKSGFHAVLCYGVYDFGGGVKGYLTHFGYNRDTKGTEDRSDDFSYVEIGISTGLADAQLGSIFSMWRV